ncbi:MAG: hypothetical protein WC847_03350 [Candidatus Paceibacterota bacterium]|jgi:hypothetical protein
MKKLSKGLVFGFLTLALVVGVGAVSANAALTFSALTIASDGALTLTGAVASNADFASTTTTGNLTMGGALTTGTLTLGNAAGTGNVVINGGLTGGANTLFNNSTTSTIAIGSAITSGTISLGNPAAAGLGSIILNSHLRSVQTVAPLTTGSTCTGPTIAATSTDTRGNLGSTSCTASQTLVAVFNRAYTTAPFCTISGSAAGGVTLSTATVAGAFVTATTAAVTITTPAVATTGAAYNYVCVE